MTEYEHKDVTEKIIAAAYLVHKQLGFGFIEKVYKNALAMELVDSGLSCNTEVPLRAFYKRKVVGEFFADVVVDNKVIVETKAVSKIDPAHEVQLVNYLKASGIRVGLLINFGTSVEVRRKVFNSGGGRDTSDTDYADFADLFDLFVCGKNRCVLAKGLRTAKIALMAWRAKKETEKAADVKTGG